MPRIFQCIIVLGFALLCAPGCGDDQPEEPCGNGTIDPGEQCDGTNLNGNSCTEMGFDRGLLTCTAACAFDTSQCSSAECGDGQVDAGEACDGSNLDGQECTDLGFEGGTLTCTDFCLFDLTDCYKCGDGQVDRGEECDGKDLGETLCSDLGYDGGELGCTSVCNFDTTRCFWATCGNGQVDDLEECDGTDLDGQHCTDLGFDGGQLRCDPSCQFDTSRCTEQACGNGTVDPEEECDGDNLNGLDCTSFGFDSGILACSPNCSFDSTKCYQDCGNGQVDPGEECDGGDLGGMDCMGLGFDTGALSCSAFCLFDTSLCEFDSCGNGAVDAGEDCDGLNLDGTECSDLGFDSGQLACGANCLFDTSLCQFDTCGNGQIDTGEVCDGTELGGLQCRDFGFDYGTLNCSATCTFDTSQCFRYCGNGQIDAGEDCDGSDLNQFQCTDLGFDSGDLACSDHCLFDTSACYLASCGNNSIDPGEHCDGSNLDGNQCTDLGYSAGSLACTAECQFDTSACTGCTPGSCPPEEYCINDQCVPDNLCEPCSSNDQCVGYTGNYGGRYCQPQIPSGDDKFCLQDCTEDTGLCQPDEICDSNGNCVAPDGCDGSLCLDGQCQGDLSCIDGVCVEDNLCEPCTQNEQCLGYTGELGGRYCQPQIPGGTDNFCLQDCTNDTGLCQPDENCDSNGNCVPPGGCDGNLCVENADCPEGQVCLDNACTEDNLCEPCTENDECVGYTGELGGRYCQPHMTGVDENFCLQDCTDDPFLCDDDETCDSLGNCVKAGGCDGSLCHEGNPTGTCPTGKECIDGICTPEGMSPGPGPNTDFPIDQLDVLCPDIPEPFCTGSSSYCGELVPFDPDHGSGYVDHPFNGETWENQYRSFIRRDNMMAIKYATAYVACLAADWTYGNGGVLGLIDMSEADGSIPGTSDGDPDHPDNTHENGEHIDICYYHKNTNENLAEPICEHHDEYGNNVNHCTAIPHLMDEWRNALLLGAIFEFPNLRIVGCDGQAGAILEAAFEQLCLGGWLSDYSCGRLHKLTYEVTNTGLGWFYHHHHHMHVDFTPPGKELIEKSDRCLIPGCSPAPLETWLNRMSAGQ